MTWAIGFTGSRKGNSHLQYRTMRKQIADELRGHVQAEFHHGACVGCDLEAHAAAWSMGYRIVLHPPTDTKLRAWVEWSDLWDIDTDIILPPKPYIERNHDIVDAVTRLIATPDGPERDSGTWATIRYARKVGVPTTVVMPDGSIA